MLAGGEKGVAIICWNDNDLKLESRKQMLLLTTIKYAAVVIIICSCSIVASCIGRYLCSEAILC